MIPEYGYVSASEWARLHDEPERSVRRWCINGEMEGAFKNDRGEWRMSKDCERGRPTVPKRNRNRPELYEGISAVEWAKKHGKSRAMAYRHLKNAKVKGAYKGPFGWDVPPDAPWPVSEDEGSK